MTWVDYGGQDVAGYDLIGTDTLQYPINVEGFDVRATVDEIKRRCGKLVRIKLYKQEADGESGDR